MPAAAQRVRDPFAEEEAAPVEPAREPFPAEQHDEIDALIVERNAAKAEARLWLRRMLTMQRERDKAQAELKTADKCLLEWQDAYRQLLRDFRRLEVKAGHAEWDIENLRTLLRHLDPFLPPDMQSPELRAAAPQVYEAIARR